MMIQANRVSGRRPDPDAHGQAALLLVESLLHGLLAKGILTIDDALAVTTAASEVKEDVADAETEAADTAQLSLMLLDRISASLESDQLRWNSVYPGGGAAPPKRR